MKKFWNQLFKNNKRNLILKKLNIFFDKQGLNKLVKKFNLYIFLIKKFDYINN